MKGDSLTFADWVFLCFVGSATLGVAYDRPAFLQVSSTLLGRLIFSSTYYEHRIKRRPDAGKQMGGFRAIKRSSNTADCTARLLTGDNTGLMTDAGIFPRPPTSTFNGRARSITRSDVRHLCSRWTTGARTLSQTADQVFSASSRTSQTGEGKWAFFAWSRSGRSVVPSSSRSSAIVGKIEERAGDMRIVQKRSAACA